jgi:phosphoglycerate kinase
LALTVPKLEDLPDPGGKSVLLRADFNVPLAEATGGVEVADDFRIRATLPTIHWLAETGARVTACSHLGRPGGKVDPRYSMAPVRRRLAELAPEVELMENLRFDPGETANDPEFVDRLVAGHDLYVNDAFGAAHRAHASIVGPPRRLPSAAGRLLAREVGALGSLLHDPARPFVAILGGAKVADKVGVLRALPADVLVIGGAMAFTFLVALGHEVGASLVEEDQVESCRELLDSGRRVVVPTDLVALGPGGEIGRGDAGTGEVRQFARTLPAGWKGLDIGPATAASVADEVAGAATVFWNGPMGVVEDGRFVAGTRTVAEAVAACGGYTVVGGGDSAAALGDFGLADSVDHVSTGGGASLELLEHGDLPGLAALRSAPHLAEPREEGAGRG